MAAFFRSLLGQNPTPEPVAPEDDFADFAEAPSPSPISLIPSLSGSLPTQPTDGSAPSTVPYTQWYRVWERTSPSDFKTEAILLPFLLLAIAFHIWGTRTNKRKARKWMAVHAPVLESEFALVGYGRHAKKPTGADEVSTDGALIKASANLSGDNLPEGLLKEKSTQDFQSYASGRQNAAFVDLKLTLSKRSNPMMLGTEYLLGLFFESLAPPKERMEAVIYTFDGREKDFVPPAVPGTVEVEKTRGSGGNSNYDGFVFAVVNKMCMRKLRDERYDASLTFTKDHAKLPAWATVMSESAEITETMLTKDVISAVEKAGEALEYLIITDQPIDKPMKLDETAPKKRLHLSLQLPKGSKGYESTLPLFHTFLRLPDHLAASAHFRPEVNRKVAATREAELKKLRKVGEKEAEEERVKSSEKIKKEERDRKMRGMTAEEQRKFLEKETAREQKRKEKRMTKKA